MASHVDMHCAKQDGSSQSHRIVFAIGLVTVGVLCLFIDERVAHGLARAIPVNHLMPLFRVLKSPGHFAFTLTIATALTLRHPLRWKAAIVVCLSGVISGIIYSLAKWCVGRTRPGHGVPALQIHPFHHGLGGLFNGENQSFPSGHTCLAFATAVSLSILIPRFWLWFYAGAWVVAFERVLQGSHYLSDVFAAAAFGVVSAFAAWRLCSSWLVLNPVSEEFCENDRHVRAESVRPAGIPSSVPVE
jgi:membrane-associated phospholipid phosphatase